MIYAALFFASAIRHPVTVVPGPVLQTLAECVQPMRDARGLPVRCGDELAAARVCVLGASDEQLTLEVIGEALSATVVSDAKGTLIRRTRVQRQALEEASVEARTAAWRARLGEVESEYKRFGEMDADEAAREYLAEVEGYTSRLEAGLIEVSSGGVASPIKLHPMRDLAWSLLREIGSKRLGKIPLGEPEWFSDIPVPGAQLLPRSSFALRQRFDRVATQLGGLLGDRASRGDLVAVDGIRRRFGRLESPFPSLGASLRVGCNGRTASLLLVIDRGEPEPLSYSETVALIAPRTVQQRTPTLPTAPIEWSPQTRARYWTPPTGNALRPRFPEELAVLDILSTWQAAIGRPMLVVVPAGLEAEIADRLRQGIDLRQGAELLASSYASLSTTESGPWTILKPSDFVGTTATVASDEATDRFVASASEKRNYDSVDYAKYLAGLSTPQAATLDSLWWPGTLSRLGFRSCRREASHNDYRLFGTLLGQGTQRWRAKFVSLSGKTRSLAIDFALSGMLVSSESPNGSVHRTRGGLDWSNAELRLDRKNHPAALWEGSILRVKTAADLAADLHNAQPDWPAELNPSTQPLIEGQAETYTMELAFPGGELIRQRFTGPFRATRPRVVGVTNLSAELRAEIQEQLRLIQGDRP